jgi:glycosyltransferase domain-containing protein
MNQLSQLTIIIPTYNRPDYAIRQFKYWGKYPVIVHILDGSDKPLNIKNDDKYKQNCFYHHLPITIEERFSYAIKLIKTEYSCLLSDDELFLPESLNSCILEIETNNLISCKGRAIEIDFSKKFRSILGFHRYKEFYNYSILNSSSEERVQSHMSNYAMVCLWSVMRSDTLKLCLKTVAEIGPLSTCTAGEICISLITAYLGKFKTINELMWIRSRENPAIWWSFGELGFYEWYLDKSMKNEVNIFKQVIVNNLSEQTGVGKHDILSHIEHAIDKYIYSIKQNEDDEFTKVKKLIFKLLLVICPNIVKELIKDIFGMRYKKTLNECANELNKNEKMIFNKDDLIYTEKFLLEFHNQDLN